MTAPAGPPAGAGEAGSVSAPLAPLAPAQPVEHGTAPPAPPARRRVGPLFRKGLAICLALAAIGASVWLLGRQVWAWRHSRAADAELAKQHYDRAKEHLAVCLSVWPDDPGTIIRAARAARRLGALEHAEQFLNDYRVLRGDDDALTIERALLRAERGEPDEVAPFCFELVKREHPQTAFILEALIAGYLQVYRVDEASACIELWQQLDPAHAGPHFMRGVAMEARTRLPDALEAYKQAIERDPDHLEARQRLAEQLLNLSQAQAALPHLEYVLAISPRHAMARVHLGRCLDQLGRQEEAEQVLEEILAEHPMFQPALQERGLLAVRSGNLAKAEPWLKKASDLAPSSYVVHYQYAQCLQRLGKTAEALALQPRLKEMEADALRLKKIVNHELPAAPNDPNLYHELGMIALRAGQAKDGLRWFETALKCDPEHVATHQALGQYYEILGQVSRSQRHRERAGSIAAPLAAPKASAPPSAPPSSAPAAPRRP